MPPLKPHRARTAGGAAKRPAAAKKNSSGGRSSGGSRPKPKLRAPRFPVLGRRWRSALAIILGLVLTAMLGRLVASAPGMLRSLRSAATGTNHAAAHPHG
jgi:hypothetical protein